MSTMSTATKGTPINFFVHEKLRQFGVDCSARAAEMQRAGTLRQVRLLAEVPVGNMVRWAVNSEPGYRRLKSKASKRAEEILDAQLANIKAIADPDLRRDAINRLRAQDWCFLRGNWPNLAHKAEREAAMLLR